MNPMMAVRQLLRDMRKQKMRTFMTMFGILWGTVSVMLLLGFGNGLYEYQMIRFKGLGENISLIWPGITSKDWEGLPRGRRIRFTEDDIFRMRATIDEIDRISPEYRKWNVPIKNSRNNKLTYVAGVWPEFSRMRNIIPQMGGRFLNDKDMAQKRRVAFLGNQIAEDMFGNDDPVGKRILIQNTPFVVIGVMKEKQQNSSYNGRDHSHIWIPSATFGTMWSYRYANMIIAQTEDNRMMPAAKKNIYRYLADKYSFDPADTEALMIWDTSEGLKVMSTFFHAFRVFLVAIGCLTLITGGIGVTNIMNVVLEERTKEIGIKMALGARRYTILAQFLLETGLLTAIGGAGGFLIAAIIIKLYPAELGQYLGMPTLNIAGALFSIGLLGLIALISGFFPARRAANLEPVKALKLF